MSKNNIHLSGDALRGITIALGVTGYRLNERIKAGKLDKQDENDAKEDLADINKALVELNEQDALYSLGSTIKGIKDFFN